MTNNRGSKKNPQKTATKLARGAISEVLLVTNMVAVRCTVGISSGLVAIVCFTRNLGQDIIWLAGVGSGQFPVPPAEAINNGA